MSLTVNAKTYTVDSINGSAFSYQGPANTTSVKDRLVQKATPAKPSTVFSGLTRFSVNMYRTHTLTGAKTATADGSAKTEFALPVGMASADIDSYCNDLGAYIASAGFKTAIKSGQANG